MSICQNVHNHQPVHLSSDFLSDPLYLGHCSLYSISCLYKNAQLAIAPWHFSGLYLDQLMLGQSDHELKLFGTCHLDKMTSDLSNNYRLTFDQGGLRLALNQGGAQTHKFKNRHR